MQRRQLIRYTGATAIAALGTLGLSALSSTQAQSTGGGLMIEWLGHSAFLLTGGGTRVLVNPFRAIGCTAGYRLPRVKADLVLISSQLWDEGAAENLPGNPKVLFEPGVYEVNGLKIQGVTMPHDRVGGNRFGMNVAWRWTQGGVKIAHLGGAAAAITDEQKILLGSPDVAMIPVGGGAKNYGPEEAKQAMITLNPRIMIPTQYSTVASDKKKCELQTVNSFLDLVKGKNVSFISGNQLLVKRNDLPKDGTLIRIFSEKGVLKG
ncbi:MAG: MBL fold metallo-hydrolase [Microcystaceae cyanobacterium]